MEVNRIIKLIAKFTASRYGCSLNAIRSNSGVGVHVPTEVKEARGAALHLTMFFGMKLTDMCDYLGKLNYGNATALRKKFIAETDKGEIKRLQMDAGNNLIV